MLTERDILIRLKDGLVVFPPLVLSVAELYPTSPAHALKGLEADALVDAAWGNHRYHFVVECKSYSSPKVLQEEIERVSAAAHAFGARPLILTSHLPPNYLDELERRQVSGIDLNGNGIVIVPNELLIRRSGQANAYPRTVPIKKVYQGRSSQVPRVFLLTPRYGSVNEVNNQIHSRWGTILETHGMQLFHSPPGQPARNRLALSTVSRVLQQLEEDLVIVREKRALRLLQPEKLLENLANGYKAPTITSRYVGRSPLSIEQITRRVPRYQHDGQARVVLTGAASVNRYATMAREPLVTIYTESDAQITAQRMELEAEPTNRFPNVEVMQTTDDLVYFDARTADDGVYASPIQVWLELMTGEKRQRDVAEQVKAGILRDLARAGGEGHHA